MRCCQNKTSFSWSYRDSSKRSLENNVISRRGREKYTHLRQVDMCKCQRVIPRHKGSPRYRIAHGWKDEFGSFNLEALKFLMHFREPGSSLYFIFTHTHIFFFSHFFFILTFFLSLFFLIFFFFFLIKFFYLLPLNSKTAMYLPPPSCLDVCSSSGKEVIKIR
jgi:hypothetical protein